MKTCKKGLHTFTGRRCLECKKQRLNQWRKDNPDKVYNAQLKYRESGYKKNAQLKSKYGISLEDYNQLLVNQEGKCKICSKHQGELTITLAVDHDHETGKVRGLLCDGCNRGIGFLKESIDNLQNAIKYLGENN